MRQVMHLMILAALLFALPLPAQEPAPDLPERLDIEWILRYEQSYGLAGLYVDEPPPPEGDLPARVRRDLLLLTRAAREYKKTFPQREPTTADLLSMGFVEDLFGPPEGTRYVYSENTGRFLCTAGGMLDLVTGAMLQLEAAEEYRRRVANTSLVVWQSWQKLAADPNAPELIRREIETRQFAVRHLDSGPVRAARRTQELLQQLSDAIEMATALGELEVGQQITMQDVGRTGLIDLLPALPLEGKYKVTKVGEPPVAVIGGIEVPLSPASVQDRLKADAEAKLKERPDYPPALSLAARYAEPEKSLELIERAVAAWPDVPALRVQRLATNAQLLNLDALTADLDYLLARFPATPILIEVDVATSKGLLRRDPNFRATIAETIASIRPEVLNAQLMALKALMDAEQSARAQAIYERLIERHPGYQPLLPEPEGGEEKTEG